MFVKERRLERWNCNCDGEDVLLVVSEGRAGLAKLNTIDVLGDLITGLRFSPADFLECLGELASLKAAFNPKAHCLLDAPFCIFSRFALGNHMQGRTLGDPSLVLFPGDAIQLDR